MLARGILFVASTWLLTGCLSVTPPEGRLVCTEATVATDCPSGWSCNDGFCYRSPADAGPGDSGIACTDASECGDGNTCTVDACTNNLCTHTFAVTQDPDQPDDAATDSNCDGVDGIAATDLYVRVGASGVGTASDPASFSGALAAFDGTQQIFVATGDHAVSAPLVVPSSASIHGGYADDFRSRPGGSRVLSSVSRALVIDAATGVTIDSVDFETADATVAGGHTQTVTIVGSTVTLRRLRIVAGDALAGAAGGSGSPGTPPAAAGPNGDNGNGTAGGAGASCGTTGGQGGGTNGPAVKGTDAVVGTGCGHGGAQGSTPNDSRDCTGMLYTYTPSNGTAGEPGCVQSNRGSLGAGASGVGSIATDGSWSGVPAGAGGAGPDGFAGGGGGGGGSYNRTGTGCFSTTPTRGGGGGGGCGGAGGDGGGGGGAGQTGGASIAIVARDSTVTLDTVMVVAGNGGDGGAGGDGGSGAAGVSGSGGGTGGTVAGSNFNTFRGGTGGAGGDGSTGGSGGCGGGGAGGWSVGVVLVGTATIDDTTATYTLGTAGAAGPRCPSSGNDPGLGSLGGAGTAQNVVGPI